MRNDNDKLSQCLPVPGRALDHSEKHGYLKPAHKYEGWDNYLEIGQKYESRDNYLNAVQKYANSRCVSKRNTPPTHTHVMPSVKLLLVRAYSTVRAMLCCATRAG